MNKCCLPKMQVVRYEIVHGECSGIERLNFVVKEPDGNIQPSDVKFALHLPQAVPNGIIDATPIFIKTVKDIPFGTPFEVKHIRECDCDCEHGRDRDNDNEGDGCGCGRRIQLFPLVKEGSGNKVTSADFIGCSGRNYGNKWAKIFMNDDRRFILCCHPTSGTRCEDACCGHRNRRHW